MWFYNGPLYTDVQVMTDQKGLTNNSSLRAQGVVQKICRKRWMIGTNAERDSGKSMLAVRAELLNFSSLSIISLFLAVSMRKNLPGKSAFEKNSYLNILRGKIVTKRVTQTIMTEFDSDKFLYMSVIVPNQTQLGK